MVTPFALPLLVFILAVFVFLYVYFQASVREVNRLNAISRSPVYSSVNDALNGLPTIRAFSSEWHAIQRHQQRLDANVILSLLDPSMNRWLTIRLDILAGMVFFVATVLMIEQKNDVSVMGFALFYVLNLTSVATISFRSISEAEKCFNAVERVAEYAKLEEEADGNIPGSVPDHWPKRGRLEFAHIEMRYRPGLPLVLKGISAVIEPGQRIGIVGRTGAG